VIRDEMEQTRANLAEKLGALENQVRETVSGATDAVSSTVEGVKDVVSSVSETVETVTETFNVSKQVEQHPWMALGAAVATGFVVAQVFGRSSEPAPGAPQPGSTPSSSSSWFSSSAQPATGAPQPQQEQRREGPGVVDSLKSMLPDMGDVMNTVVSSVGGMAVGSLMGLIREFATQGLPQEWHGDVTKLIDQVTSQLGGKPLDPTRSDQLFNALGLGGHPQGGTSGNGGTHSQGAGRQPAQGR